MYHIVVQCMLDIRISYYIKNPHFDTKISFLSHVEQLSHIFKLQRNIEPNSCYLTLEKIPFDLEYDQLQLLVTKPLDLSDHKTPNKRQNHSCSPILIILC